MTINLLLDHRFKDYCRGCPKLDVKAAKNYVGGLDVKTVLYCAHELQCKKIEQHIKKMIEMEDSND